jgi:branched-subunit amino acid transport protein
MTLREALLIAGMALVTFAVRYPVLSIFSKVEFPPVILGALKFIPPAVLAAIIAPALLAPNGQLDLSPHNDFLVAGIVAALVAWRTNNLLATIFLGMLALWLWRWLLAMG